MVEPLARRTLCHETSPSRVPTRRNENRSCCIRKLGPPRRSSTNETLYLAEIFNSTDFPPNDRDFDPLSDLFDFDSMLTVTCPRLHFRTPLHPVVPNVGQLEYELLTANRLHFILRRSYTWSYTSSYTSTLLVRFTTIWMIEALQKKL